ncbi:flagellar hook-length control protein FliK [Dyella flagellata]|uniref:Flagellar hook-length control protein-like C-terminal domain-containing protein n=1 Tax=Dyella flagellata TaxID=1867833 RepID=A0ABQ5X572_9GAMM|nr:flagellar hook-length control protein FliK [Dyella flagellata]GLQ86770.1 hypothetical protein GCM10007898_03360 [Dyella flagellata]
MSAIPLPALPAMPNQLAQPTSVRSQHGGISFHSHLESAQQSQPPPQDTPTAAQKNDQGQGGNNAQNDSAKASDSSSNADKPGDDTDAAQNDNGPGVDLAGGVGTLVGAVLSLIDHAHGDAHAGAASGSAKPATGNKQPASPQPAAPNAAMIPMPLSAIAPMPLAATAASAQQGNNAIGSALSSNLSLGFDAKDGDTSAGDASTTGASGADAGSLMQGITDGAQTLAGNAAAGNHLVLPATATLATDNASPNTSGITALGNLTANAPIVPASNAAHSLAMSSQVGSSGFAKELGQQITWLSGQEVKQAQIRLHPQDLGPLDVKVSVEHGRVDVSFLTQHPDATAAVQQGLDQLQQMLGGQGLSLGHATVGQHAQQQFAGQSGQQAPASAGTGDEAADTPIATAARVAIGLVDAFA